MKHLLRTLLVAASGFVATQAWSQTMTFEGLNNQESVNTFYSGGTGSQGSTGGQNLQVSFLNTLALIDSDSGGSGNFANEPSPNTIMFFVNSPAIMNVPGGFSTGFAFRYTSAANTTVTVYDGVDGTGNVLATLPLAAQFNLNCTGDPTGEFCNWTEVGVAFEGVARSVSFAGTIGAVGIDDITINSAVVASKTFEENIACARDLIMALPANQVTGLGQRNLMNHLLGNVLIYQTSSPNLALSQLNTVISRTDGCALRTTVDTMANQGGLGLDYITNCPAQAPIYACLVDARTQLTAPVNNK